MRYSIGIDVGGTNIRIAVVDEDGNLYDVIKESTKAKTIDGLKEQILELYLNILFVAVIKNKLWWHSVSKILLVAKPKNTLAVHPCPSLLFLQNSEPSLPPILKVYIY